MADVLQVLVSRELHVDAGRLKDHADMLAEASRIGGRVAAVDHCAAAHGQHQRGKDAEHGRLTAAIGAEQAEDLGGINVEGDALECGASVIGVLQVFDVNHCIGRIRLDGRSCGKGCCSGGHLIDSTLRSASSGGRAGEGK